MGSDYSMYAYFYEIVDPTSLRNSLAIIPQEPGFVILMMACRRISDDPRLLFTVASVITVFVALIAIRKLSVNPTFSIFLYFFLTYYTFSFNAVRQSIAVSLMLFGESFRVSSKPRWIMLSILAMSFHSSTVIVFLIQIAITRWKPRAINSLLILFIGTPIGIAIINSGPVLGWLSALNPRYNDYITADDRAGMGTMLILGVRILVIIWALFELSRRKDRSASKYLAMVIISALALSLGLSSVVVARLEPFFGIYLILLIPALLQEKHKANALKLFISAGTLAYFGVHIISFNGLIPYQIYPL